MTGAFHAIYQVAVCSILFIVLFFFEREYPKYYRITRRRDYDRTLLAVFIYVIAFSWWPHLIIEWIL